MSEPVPESDPAIPEMVPRLRHRFPIVWAIPVVAALLAGWLVWNTVADKGPEIVIRFRNAEGLAPGRTKVRYKAVDVGTVTKVQISSDLDSVLVTARMVKGAERILKRGSRFWIVRPRIEAGGVSGLTTLISGAYIEVDPGSGETSYEFVGLDEPPLIRSNEPGRSFILEAASLRGISRGAPVYNRGVEVGQVLGYQLNAKGEGVEIFVFVRAPYDRLVHTDSAFWNASGIEIGTGAGGFYLRMTSLQALVMGGISFRSGSGIPAAAETHFPLLEGRRQVEEFETAGTTRFLIFFDGSVRGLRRGSPVEFRGIEIGRVLRVGLEIGPDPDATRIPVLIAIRRDPFTRREEEAEGGRPITELMASLVSRGLRAQLQTANLLTGDLLVSLDFHEEAPAGELREENGVPVIPSVPRDLDSLTASVRRLLDKLLHLPLEETLQELRKVASSADQLLSGPPTRDTLAAVREAARSLQRVTHTLEVEAVPSVAELRKALDRVSRAADQAHAAFANLRGMTAPDSRFRQNVGRLLVELADAARSVRQLAEYLERNPQALLRGRGR